MPTHGWTLKTLQRVKEANRERSDIVWFHFCETSRTGKPTRTESRRVAARGWGTWGNWVTALGYGVSFWSDEHVLGRWRWQLHNLVNVRKPTKLSTLNKGVNFTFKKVGKLNKSPWTVQVWCRLNVISYRLYRSWFLPRLEVTRCRAFSPSSLTRPWLGSLSTEFSATLSNNLRQAGLYLGTVTCVLKTFAVFGMPPPLTGLPASKATRHTEYFCP